MWYLKLLEYLAIKICPDDGMNAVSFIKSWIGLLEQEFYDGVWLEPLVIFGLAIDLYHYSNQNKGKNISSTEFAKKCIGLTVLHVKSSEDESVFCVDFAHMISEESILKFLDIDKRLLLLKKQYLSGERKHSKVQPVFSLTDINMYIANRVFLNEAIFTDVVKEFERKTFRELNYFVKVEIKDMVLLLNEFLSQQKNPTTLLINLNYHLLPYKNSSPHFDQLIEAVQRNIRSVESHERTEKRGANASKCAFLQSSKSNSIKEIMSQCPKSKLRLKPFKINLVLIPKLELNKLPHNNPAIINLCAALNVYSEKTSYNSYSFYACNFRKHRSEVSVIVSEILKGNLPDISAIIQELKKIKISNPGDELLDIIDSFDMDSVKEQRVLSFAKN